MQLVLTRSLWGLERDPIRYGAAIRGVAASSPIWDAVSCPVQLIPDLAEFSRLVAAEIRPITDHRSTAEYRRHAAGVLARRLLERCLA